MVTKAELEAEVEELRRLLAEEKASKIPDPADAPSADHENGGPMMAALENWPEVLEDALSELEDLPQKKPILFALGIFAVGYLIGRSR